MKTQMLAFLALPWTVSAFVPMIDGGKTMPKLYDGYMNEQIAKQASTAVAKAIAAGYKKIEVNFPPVPNLDEVRFGTPLNQKFGIAVVAKDLNVQGGYRPGSDLARQLVAFSNIYWAKKVAGAAKGGVLGNKCVACLTTEPVTFSQIKNLGDISRVGAVMSAQARQKGRSNEAIICVNPGGEERWDQLVSAHAQPGQPFVVLNNAYSTTYGLGNKRGFEEAYFLKRISKGWIFRMYPGPWQAFLEKPNGSVELLESYTEKPELKDVATFVREESFRRYTINNDRWTPGYGERL